MCKGRHAVDPLPHGPSEAARESELVEGPGSYLASVAGAECNGGADRAMWGSGCVSVSALAWHVLSAARRQGVSRPWPWPSRDASVFGVRWALDSGCCGCWSGGCGDGVGAAGERKLSGRRQKRHMAAWRHGGRAAQGNGRMTERDKNGATPISTRPQPGESFAQSVLGPSAKTCKRICRTAQDTQDTQDPPPCAVQDSLAQQSGCSCYIDNQSRTTPSG